MPIIVLAKEIDAESIQSINEKLNYRSVFSGIYGKVGDWIISNEGDLIFMGSAIPGCYSIYSQQLEQQDWDKHLSSKSWYPEVRDDFLCAISIAKNLNKGHNG